MEEMLHDFDALIRVYREEGVAPSAKDLETLRAKVALAVAPFRLALVYPAVEEEVE